MTIDIFYQKENNFLRAQYIRKIPNKLKPTTGIYIFIKKKRKKQLEYIQSQNRVHHQLATT